MGLATKPAEQHGEAPPPPAGPPAVDPAAPGLSRECFGIENQKGGVAAPVPARVHANSSSPSVATASEESKHDASPRRPFNTELDVCEIDDRGRPGTVWSARARELSRGELVFHSRRMCYVGRQKLVLIHLIDHTPVAVCGAVESSEYEGEGLYRVELRLKPVPHTRHILEWIEARVGRGRRP
ncbi:MAG: hypothetical protein R3B57_10480 [Phycisphaerales bacterium]